MEAEWIARRARAMTSITFLALLGLLLQLGNLQFREAGYWKRLSDSNRTRPVPVTAPRGEILDRAGKVLASNRPVYSLTILPSEEKELEAVTIPNLAAILAKGDPTVKARRQAVMLANLKEARSKRLHDPVTLATDLDQESMTAVFEKREDLPGLNLETLPVRNYPNGSLAAHVLGYTGEAGPGEVGGKSGLELQFDEVLRGSRGRRMMEVDVFGRYKRELDSTPPKPGQTLNLTIDLDVQRIAEAHLATRMAEIRQEFKGEEIPPTAHAGAVVALEVKTGAVLAMASYPTFDPNRLATGKIEPGELNDPKMPFLNRALSGAYSPGSTWKMVTSLAALEEGVITPFEIIVSGDRYWDFHRPREWKRGGHGPVDMIRAIALSSDIYFYEAGRRLGPDRLAKWAGILGFGHKTGIDLPGEASGINPNKATYGDQWYPGEILSLAIGQGRITSTALQLASYTATIANHGVRYRPHLVQGGGGAGEKLTIKPDHLKTVHKGMLEVTSPGGTANAFYYPKKFPVRVAGKTGTAELGIPGKADNGLFVAFAPAEDPKIAVAVIIEGAGGGARTAPITRAIIGQYLFGSPEPYDKPYDKSLTTEGGRDRLAP